MVTTNNQDQLAEWASKVLDRGFPRDAEFLGQILDGEIRAVVVFCDFKGKSCNLHIASQGGNWMTRKLLWFTFHYAFEKRGLKVIIGIVSGANEKALKLDRHLGFVETARIADAHEDGDLVILTMKPHQCRWLTLGNRYGC